jgi:hypothetical protein
MLLKRHGKADGLYEPERLYGKARAAFERVIAVMQASLAEGRDPADSKDLLPAIEHAVDRRLAFAAAAEKALPRRDGARSFGWDGLIKPGIDLVKGLIDAGIAIWKEYRRGDELRRKTLMTQIGALRWQSFAAIQG